MKQETFTDIEYSVRLCQFVCTCHGGEKTLHNLTQGGSLPFFGNQSRKADK